ncbi:MULTISPECIES: acyltransferase [Rhodococcus]|jgi:acetyltransferase-like isoleucine patch superfamily enzyme|uniref:acyltransferase n=1 Tax=Rhodococcus TaxID=1827 RepID=UPI000AD15F02|nr:MULTISPECIES: acyltransferase [Rhodococcus]
MLTVDDRGERNTVAVDGRSRDSLNGTVIFRGNDNHISVGPGCTSAGMYLDLGSESSVRINARTVLNDIFVFTERDGHFTVGSDSGFNGSTRILMHEPGRVDMGSGVLFAGQIDVSISDMHSIIDVETSERINPAKDIEIGNRVWIGQRSMVLKGARIGDGSVVGAMSLVRGTLPGNCVCAGVPAKVLRSGATWRFDLVPSMENRSSGAAGPPVRSDSVLTRLRSAARIMREG